MSFSRFGACDHAQRVELFHGVGSAGDRSRILESDDALSDIYHDFRGDLEHPLTCGPHGPIAFERVVVDACDILPHLLDLIAEERQFSFPNAVEFHA